VLFPGFWRRVFWWIRTKLFALPLLVRVETMNASCSYKSLIRIYQFSRRQMRENPCLDYSELGSLVWRAVTGLGLPSVGQINFSLGCKRNLNVTPKTMFRRADLMPNLACTIGSLICLLTRSAPFSSSRPNTSPDVSTPWNTSSSQDHVRASSLEIDFNSTECLLFVLLFVSFLLVLFCLLSVYWFCLFVLFLFVLFVLFYVLFVLF